ncbi:MAG: OadG family protein [Clostridiales bacterium]|jgi:hypothetical protein|nr:OadG family protein [Eubacteriales bacterium]MDD4711075.1 OadG family protein [Eubacteriales bacterium]NLO15724.1 OadG family protein [Clostridiales bacterium]
MTDNINTVVETAGGEFSSVIVWLIFVAVVFFLVRHLQQKKKKAAQEVSRVETPHAAPEASPAVRTDGPLVAAITAAISAVMMEEGKSTGFVVRRIRRAGPRLR